MVMEDYSTPLMVPLKKGNISKVSIMEPSDWYAPIFLPLYKFTKQEHWSINSILTKDNNATISDNKHREEPQQ